jgi:hypothetical protein
VTQDSSSVPDTRAAAAVGLITSVSSKNTIENMKQKNKSDDEQVWFDDRRTGGREDGEQLHEWRERLAEFEGDLVRGEVS